LVLGGCGIRKKFIIKKVQRAEEAVRPQGLEFERLPSLQKTQSEEERKKGREAIDRVKMFVKEIGPRDDSSNEGEGSGASGNNEPRVVQFHRPRPSVAGISIDEISPVSGRSRQNTVASMSPSTMGHSRHNISNSIDTGLSFEPDDQVIQYERPEIQQQEQHVRQQSGTGEPRRFVMEHLPPTQTQYKQKDFIESDSSE
jgi:hypothetical protein